ncbi:MAG: mono/diheme cytochrome c family protein [Janthinobacterium sp.]|jgi:mono/diheme cytochrome c family protein
MKKTIIAIISLGLILTGLILARLLWPADDIGPPASNTADLSQQSRQDQITRGAYLAKAGNCMACHTTRGGADYAGGRAILTPFGAILSPNITSDQEHGIGSWSSDDFWRALHNGKSKDGRLLYPAFPYTNYTKITRDDADALHAFFQTVPANPLLNLPHRLRFPYNQQIALAAWRALYFRPAVWRDDSDQSFAWNRGAYLVNGLGHCSACHSSRNQLGATTDGLSGGLIPVLGWYAPSLMSNAEAGVGDWDTEHVVQLLKTGTSPRAIVSGPMAEVVQASLQYLSEADLGAMAVYLKTLSAPAPAVEPAPVLSPFAARAFEAQLKLGAKLYETHCMDCHQANGSGRQPAYPALAGNRAVMMEQAVNPIRSVLHGGFAPSTKGNARPYGMPPYGPLLSDDEVAAVVSYVRHAWGNEAAPVSALDVNRQRSVPID